MKKTLEERQKLYVTEEAPLGPSDAYQIKDDEVAASLCDPHNKSFNTLLRKEISIVIGRRGSGKTALLNSYRYHRFFEKDSFLKTKSAGMDLKRYQYVIEVKTGKQFEEMRKLATGNDQIARPIEAVIEDWEQHILDFFLAKLYEKAPRKGPGQKFLSQIAAYLYQNENEASRDKEYSETVSEPDKLARLIIHGVDEREDGPLVRARKLVWGEGLWRRLRDRFFGETESVNKLSEFATQENAMEAATKYLEEVKKKALLIFDSMDEYEVGNPIFDRTIGALLRFTANFNSTCDSIKIKLGLPSEIVHELSLASTNPLKDFVQYDRVQWSSTELLQIAAFRYRLFLELYNPTIARKLEHLDFHTREGVVSFWSSFFPAKHMNIYGTNEDVLTYLLRHTQLLPRQLFMILQKIIVYNNSRFGGYDRFRDEAVIESVETMETEIAREIFGAFKHVYSGAERVGKAIFANLETVFEYKELEKQWKGHSRNYPLNRNSTENQMVDLITMLLRMGIIGIFHDEDDRYVIGNFYYNALNPPNVGSERTLCLHPIFSRHFNAKPNSFKKAILPHGIPID